MENAIRLLPYVLDELCGYWIWLHVQSTESKDDDRSVASVWILDRFPIDDSSYTILRVPQEILGD